MALLWGPDHFSLVVIKGYIKAAFHCRGILVGFDRNFDSRSDRKKILQRRWMIKKESFSVRKRIMSGKGMNHFSGLRIDCDS